MLKDTTDLKNYLNADFKRNSINCSNKYLFFENIRRTRQTLWRAVQMLTQKLCCQTIHDCPKVVPLHYESEWQ